MIIRPEKSAVGWRVLKALWILACVGVLATTLIYFRTPEYPDAGVGLFLTMMALSFPSGWLSLVLLRVSEMLNLFDIRRAGELQTILLAWATLFVLGYLQWFVLVPAIVCWWRRKFGNGAPSNISVVPKD